jgi:hypothetical protein
MASIAIHKKVNKGRIFIRVAVTPKSAETRALLRRFQTEVKEFEKKWKSSKAYHAAQAKKAKKKKAAKK